MENTQNLEQQLYQFRYLRQQRDMLQNQLEILNASLSNLLNTKATVENLKNIKDGDEILVPIGGMVNIKAQIKETEKILLYVGQDIVIEKDLDGTFEFIDQIIEQHNEQIKFLSSQIQKLDITLQGMSENLQRAYPQQSSLNC